jgi:hypothetical protein
MKTKYILLLAITAIITLSFSFVSVKKEVNAPVQSAQLESAPIGGITLGDEL